MKEFAGKTAEPEKLQVRDIIALLIPRPPCTNMDAHAKEKYMEEIRERYRIADLIIGEVR